MFKKRKKSQNLHLVPGGFLPDGLVLTELPVGPLEGGKREPGMQKASRFLSWISCSILSQCTGEKELALCCFQSPGKGGMFEQVVMSYFHSEKPDRPREPCLTGRRERSCAFSVHHSHSPGHYRWLAESKCFSQGPGGEESSPGK